MSQLAKFLGLTGLLAMLASAIEIEGRALFDILRDTAPEPTEQVFLAASSGPSEEPALTVGRLSPTAQAPRPVPVPEPEPEPSAPSVELGRVFERTEGWLAEARFRAALVELETVRPATDQAAPLEKARFEVLTATAQLALGRGDQAAESLRRALVADAELALDPSTTPPKVRRLLAEVRREQGR